jgi:hypothetical protein
VLSNQPLQASIENVSRSGEMGCVSGEIRSLVRLVLFDGHDLDLSRAVFRVASAVIPLHWAWQIYLEPNFLAHPSREVLRWAPADDPSTEVWVSTPPVQNASL